MATTSIERLYRGSWCHPKRCQLSNKGDESDDGCVSTGKHGRKWACRRVVIDVCWPTMEERERESVCVCARAGVHVHWLPHCSRGQAAPLQGWFDEELHWSTESRPRPLRDGVCEEAGGEGGTSNHQLLNHSFARWPGRSCGWVVAVECFMLHPGSNRFRSCHCTDSL